MSRWSELYNRLKKEHKAIKTNHPATLNQVAHVEKTLGVRLPDDIKEFLLEMNGDGWFVFSADEIIETNLRVRTEMTSYMSLDCLLFFAGNGCGDYYGYPITRDGIRDDNVFIWEHEYDNRIWRANSIEDAIRKYYNDEI